MLDFMRRQSQRLKWVSILLIIIFGEPNSKQFIYAEF